MLTVAVIGTGFGAKVHVPGWQKNPGVMVAGVAGHSWQKTIKDPNVDIISIATPPFVQAEIAIAALKNNKTVLLEKPAGLNLKETKQIATLAKKKLGLVAVDFELRFVPHFQFLKDLIAAKAIGDLRAIHITWITGGRAENAPNNWSNYIKGGGGVLLNYGTHVIDYVQWLFSDFAAVLGKLDIIKKPASKPIPDADDTVAILGVLKNKMPVKIFISNVVHNGSGHTVEIYGSTGTIILKNSNVFDAVKGFELYKTNTKGELELLKIPARYVRVYEGTEDGRIAPFQKLAKELITVLKTKKQSLVLPTITDAVKVQKVINAIFKSDRAEKWEKV